MNKYKLFNGFAMVIALLITPTFSSISIADDEAVEEVVVVGSRREARSVGDAQIGRAHV